MKLLSFVHDGRANYGAVGDDGGVADLGRRSSEHPDLRRLGILSNRVVDEDLAGMRE